MIRGVNKDITYTYPTKYINYFKTVKFVLTTVISVLTTVKSVLTNLKSVLIIVEYVLITVKYVLDTVKYVIYRNPVFFKSSLFIFWGFSSFCFIG